MPDVSSQTLSLVKTKGGCFSLKIACDEGPAKTLHSLYDPEKEARSAVEAFHFDGTGFLVVLGLGLGYHVAELKRRFPGTEILVVEPASEIYEMARTHGNLPGDSTRIRYMVGLETNEVVREVTRHQIRCGMAPVSVYPLPPAVSCFPAYYGPILDTLKKTSAARLWEKLKYPKFTEKSTRVAIIDFGYFLTREVQNALGRLEHSVTTVPVRKGEKGNAIVSKIIDAVLSHRPDFFLTINHLGFDEDGEVTSFFKAIEMPVASWFVDSPNLIVKAFGRNVSPFTTLFLWDKSYLTDMESMGFESLVHLPLATDERIFRPLRRNGRRSKATPWDVGFVGNSMVEPVNDRICKVEPELHALVERLAQAVLLSRLRIEDCLAELPESDRNRVTGLDPREKIDFEAAVLWKTTLLYRLQCMKKLNDLNLRIHGDTGWEALLDGREVLGPPLDYYRELPLFYNRCKVNFNATNFQMGEAVNQRVFDVPACGGFLLTDRQDALEELFDVGEEIVAFDQPDEIPDLVRFYLDHPGLRKRIALRGRERILKEHTYRHRLDRILQTMKARYG